MNSFFRDNMFRINEVAEKFKVNTNILRFYEKKKLLTPSRDDNGYRMYSLEDMLQFQTILLYRKMGFSIDDISKMLTNDGMPIELFFKQYGQINHHIHTMRMISNSLEECIDLMFDEDRHMERLTLAMKKTAGYIAQLERWEDKWDFDHLAIDYDNFIKIPHSGLDFYKHYDKVISITKDKVNEKIGTVAEIGVGTGNLAGKLMETQNVVGIDQSVNMLIAAKRKFPELKLRMGTFMELPLRDNTVDTVVSCYAFHHCNTEERIIALREMDRVLKSEGRIIITDLMFYDKTARENFEKSCSETEFKDLQDEFFSTVLSIKADAESLGYSCKYEQIDELIWILVFDK